MTLPLAILNTSIATADGMYRLRTISLDEARELVADAKLDSAVGHEATAQMLTKLLGRSVPVNRQQFKHAPGQQALVFKLNSRPPEGQVLSIADMEKIGYVFQVLERIDTDGLLKQLNKEAEFIGQPGVYNDDTALLPVASEIIQRFRSLFGGAGF